MKTNEFIDRLCSFARDSIAVKCTNPMTQMTIGAATCGVGRRIVEAKLVPILGMCVDDQGELDICGIRESALAGLRAAGKVPVLGGAISLDANDAEEFFASIGV